MFVYTPVYVIVTGMIGGGTAPSEEPKNIFRNKKLVVTSLIIVTTVSYLCWTP